MATDARGHIAPAGGETPRRAAINDLSLSINDVVMVPNDTGRAQALVDLGSSAARPLIVRQQDTGLVLIHDGTGWRLLTSPAVDATFGLNTGLWVAEGGHTPTLQRRGDLWMFSGRVRNAGAGSFSAGNAALGTLPVEARVPSGGSLTSAAAYRSGATWGSSAPVSVNLSTGAVAVAIPTAVTVGAGALDIAWAGITWAARPAVI